MPIDADTMDRCTAALEQLDLEAGDGELFVLMGRQAERVVRTVLAVVEGREEESRS